MGRIKEGGARTNKDESAPGVVPKDLGFGLLKDLIDEIEEDDSDASKKKRKEYKRKKTHKN